MSSSNAQVAIPKEILARTLDLPQHNTIYSLLVEPDPYDSNELRCCVEKLLNVVVLERRSAPTFSDPDVVEERIERIQNLAHPHLQSLRVLMRAYCPRRPIYGAGVRKKVGREAVRDRGRLR
eukprot:CAMPEP_0169352184 /NCGR_PEP_ID=MMETSP1017-20121227/25195_1 /TAXON_ID=342587 /ORGANISM="Karlodinium micrum, Strain CCMP2283" /LENGTH=121 /DNA_ID=CAMNT_0009448531 /DNA_START=189 /DNA_END=555 /DNA_ORIENTATION=-